MAVSRNPKTVKFSVGLTSDINTRIEQLSDIAGSNKTVLTAMCISAGLNLLERVYMVGVEQYAEKAAEDKLALLENDLKLAGKK